MPKDLLNPKYARLLAIAALLVLGVLAAGFGHHDSKIPKSACGVYRTDRVVTIGQTKINAEVAITPADRQKGLSGRPCIEPNQGMLFLFSRPGQYSFWMKDMKFSIDIVWITSDHKVAAIYNDIEPSTYPDSFVNDKRHPAQYTLEIKAKLAKSLGLELGTPVKF